MESTACIAIIIIWIIKTILSQDDIIIENNDPEFQNLDLQETINQFYSTWNMPSLKRLMYQQIEKYPSNERSLSKAFNTQFKLLQGIEKKCDLSIEKTKQLLKNKLDNCNTIQSVNILKKQFEWVLEKVPEMNELFEIYQLKLNIKKTTIFKKHLFNECLSLDSAKKRFRRLSLLNHPDKGGSTAAMKEIIRQYEECLKKFNT